MESAMEIKLEKLSKIYEQGPAGTMAVSDIELTITSGEFFFLLGPSGCGKTTLLRLIAGLLIPTAGKILFNEKNVTDLPAEKRKTAMVFQGYALWPHMTVRENVEFGPKMQGLDADLRRRYARDQLERVQMSAFAGRKPNQLSGGQQQRVALARALAAGSDCLLLDEPLSNLDARLRLHMREEIRHLVKSSGMTAVYVTHDQKEALSMADRIAVMDSGRIAQVGAPEQIYNRPETRFTADFLGEANFLPGRIIKQGSPMQIRLEKGTVLLAEKKEMPVNTLVSGCIRPEHISFSEDHAVPPDAVVLPAVIQSRTYLGEIQQYLCTLENEGLSVRVTLLSAAVPKQPGQRVGLRIDAMHVTILAE